MAALSITLRQGVCPRAQTGPTRLLRPDGLTRPEYQLTRPMWLTRILMTSAWHNCDVSMHSRHDRKASAWCNCDVSMHRWHAMSTTSQLTRQHSGTHLPRHQPRAEPSRAELEPSWAASRGTGSSVADPTCNRIWDWIWAVHQARIVLIKS